MRKIAEISANTNSTVKCISIWFIYVCVESIVIILNINTGIKIVISIVALFITIVFGNIAKESGVYIEDNHVYYKYFKKHQVIMNHISGIKVTKISSLGVGGYYKDYRGFDGKLAFNMFFLKTIKPGMISFSGRDDTFKRLYKDCIFFCCEYNLDFINIVKKTNPHLIVLDDITNVPN